MQRGNKIIRIFGIDLKLHFSWWFIFVFITWNLATSFFPKVSPELSTTVYWLMGIVAAFLLFVSVVLHELSHSLVAKAKKIKVESITLFFFGGVASISDEDLKPSSEFLMAIAGPLFSLLLAGIFYGIHVLNGNLVLTAITLYLYQLNLVVAFFNLVPGFPLDGGRAFRAILHAYYKDVTKATRIAARGGKFFAGILIFMGLLSLLGGLGEGLWPILLGIFLYFIAGMSYEQVLVREVLRPIPLTSVLTTKFPVLNPSMRFKEFLQQYSFSNESTFIVRSAAFTGILDVKQLESMPEKMRDIVTLEQLATPLSKITVLKKSDNAYIAFTRFSEQQLDFVPVVEKGKIRGIVPKTRVMHLLTLGLKYGVPALRLVKGKKPRKA